MSSSDSGRVAGKVIVVTGAGGGQGEIEVDALVAEGASVVAVDLEAPAERAGVTPVALDVSDPAGWDALRTRVDEQFGRVDGLINNAGIASRAPIGQVELDDWNRVIAVNATGPMLGIQALLPLMGAGGSIVNVCSLAALNGHGLAAYTASKWALRGLTHTCVTTLGPQGIRVNAVMPGYIDTPITAGSSESFRQGSIDVTPLGRVGEPEDIAGTMVFLMSDESAYISGAEISIDGGLHRSGLAKYIGDLPRW